MTHVIVNKDKSLGNNKKTYSVGDWFLDTDSNPAIDGTLLMLIHCAGNAVDCIYVETGETHNAEPITVQDPWEITEEELKMILGEHYPAPTRIKKVAISLK